MAAPYRNVATVTVSRKPGPPAMDLPLTACLFAGAVTATLAALAVAQTSTARLALAALLALPFLALGFLMMIWSPDLIVYALVAGACLTLFNIKIAIAGAHVRPNMVFAALAGAAWIARIALGIDRPRRVPYLLPLALVDVVYAASTLLHTPHEWVTRGLMDCFLYALNVLQYAMVVWFLERDRGLAVRAAKSLLAGTAFYSGATSLLFLAARLNLGWADSLTSRIPGSNVTRIDMLWTTQGSYLAFAVIVPLCLLVFFPRGMGGVSRRFVLSVLLINLAGLVLTFARGPWLAVLATLPLLFVFAAVRYPIRRGMRRIALATVLASMAALLASILLIAFVPKVSAMVAARGENIVNLSGTAMGRIQLWDSMWDGFKKAPVFGRGARTWERYTIIPRQATENFAIELLYSSGLAGAGTLLSAVVAISLGALRRIWTWPRASLDPWTFALFWGFVAMFGASMTNPAAWGGYFWIVMGALVSTAGAGRPPATPCESESVCRC